MATATKTRNVIGEATYKENRYAVLWIGQTKYGYKAKLAYRNLAKEFWVPELELSDYDEFPQPIAEEDYTAKQPRRGQHIPDAHHTDRRRQPPQPDGPSYCAHCGQVIPS